jgi:hypothetical protein
MTVRFMDLRVPKSQLPADAAVFTQDGVFVLSGHREACEERAREVGGLYCWFDRGRPVIRTDFEDVNFQNGEDDDVYGDTDYDG